MWYEAWCKAVEAARDGLTATLIIKHPKSGRLYVNFDPEILQLIRQAEAVAVYVVCRSRGNLANCVTS